MNALAALRRAPRPPGQHARARAGAHPRRAGRPAPPAARSSATPGTARPIATPSTSRTRSGTPSSRRASTPRCSRSAAVAAVAMSLGLLTRVATATTFATRHLQRLPLHHPLPQQPGLPDHRARDPRGGAVRARALPRRVAAPAPRAPGARPDGAGLAAVAAAVRVRRGLRGIRPSASSSIPTGSAARSPGSGSCRPATTSRPGRCPTGRSRCSQTADFHVFAAKAIVAHRALHRARPVVARHPLRGRLGRGGLPPDDRGLGVGSGLLDPRDRGARRLGGALHPGPGPPPRPGLIRPAAPRPPGERPRLARPLPGRARHARVEPGAHRPRRRRVRGGPAVALTLSRLPLTAWFALPSLLLPAVRRARRAGREMMRGALRDESPDQRQA